MVLLFQPASFSSQRYCPSEYIVEAIEGVTYDCMLCEGVPGVDGRVSSILRWDFQASFCRCEPGVGGREVKLTWGRSRISMVGGVGGWVE